jgi:hypothetical protein
MDVTLKAMLAAASKKNPPSGTLAMTLVTFVVALKRCTYTTCTEHVGGVRNLEPTSLLTFHFKPPQKVVLNLKLWDSETYIEPSVGQPGVVRVLDRCPKGDVPGDHMAAQCVRTADQVLLKCTELPVNQPE